MAGTRTLAAAARALGALFLAAAALAAQAGGDAALPSRPSWVVDPADPGVDLPPVGRSLFDYLMALARDGPTAPPLPASFIELRQRIEAQLARDPAAPLPGPKQVLIPLGRSLQRTSGAPDFFGSPRIVLAVDEGPAPASPLRLADRLFLGYQPKANVVEVIAYNEAAGRYEFQVLKDFGVAGRAPRLVYARRQLCMACHQNGGPIFSLPGWDETNANAQVAAAIVKARGREFFGVPVERGVDVPNAIDASSDRANLLAAWQMLWRDGCGASRACRVALTRAVLQYALSGQRRFDRESPAWRRGVIEALLANGRARWPNGLAVGSADLPDRDPLALPTSAARRGDVGAAFDPLAPRAPLEVWRFDAADAVETLAERLVAGLASFLAEADVRRLDERLAAGRAPWREVEAACRFEPNADRIRFECAGEALALKGEVEAKGHRLGAGSLDELKLGAQGALRDLALGAATLQARRARLPLRADRLAHARGADGRRIERVELAWSGDRAGSARVRVADDVAPLDAAIDALADERGFDGFDALPFRRARLLPALFAKLGLPPLEACCLDAARLPAPSLDAAASGAPTRPTGAFYRHCAACHLSADRVPPNFLHGDSGQVERQLAHCAERLAVRLAMWRSAPEARTKTPMPPPPALRREGFAGDTAWRDGAELAQLDAYVAGVLREQTGHGEALAQLLARDYESLRPCLPATSAR
jgi:hypothetical protein